MLVFEKRAAQTISVLVFEKRAAQTISKTYKSVLVVSPFKESSVVDPLSEELTCDWLRTGGESGGLQ